MQFSDRCALWKNSNCAENLFCRRCNFNRWVSAANSLVGEAEVMDLMSALRKVSLMFGTRGSVAVKALFYKPEGRGIDSR
jgi:hypothetical protein